jgi:hypothetical protein
MDTSGTRTARGAGGRYPGVPGEGGTSLWGGERQERIRRGSGGGISQTDELVVRCTARF